MFKVATFIPYDTPVITYFLSFNKARISSRHQAKESVSKHGKYDNTSCELMID